MGTLIDHFVLSFLGATILLLGGGIAAARTPNSTLRRLIEAGCSTIATILVLFALVGLFKWFASFL